MIRRFSMAGLATALMVAGIGCRASCSNGGLFTSANTPGECRLVGRSDVMMAPGGAPGTFVPGNAVPLVPGDGTQLPYPQPADLIPRTGVPVPPAIPSPAPGDGGAAVLPVPKIGVPVKGN